MKVSGSIVNGSGYIAHNERKFTRSNVDSERTKNNIVIKNESLEEAYNKLFGASVDEYNSKQKRADRKKSVESYLEEIEKNKHKKGAEKPFYEVIIQIGDKDTCNVVNNPEEAERAKECLLEYVKQWDERNPNLHIFNATLHMDEATPHLHIDYIPVAEGYKQGLERRNSLSKALEIQGLGKHVSQFNNGAVRWQEQEREALAELGRSYGFEIVEQGVQREHLTVAEYKKLVKEAEKSAKIVSESVSIDKGITSRLFVSKSQIEQLEAREKAIAEKEALIEQAINRTKQVNETYEKARSFYDEKMSEIDNREHFFNKLAENLEKQQAEAEEKMKEAEKILADQRSLNERHARVQAELTEARKKLKRADEEKEQAKQAVRDTYHAIINKKDAELEKVNKKANDEHAEGYKKGYLEGQLRLLEKEGREVIYWNGNSTDKGLLSFVNIQGKKQLLGIMAGTGLEERVNEQRAKDIMSLHKNIRTSEEKRKESIKHLFEKKSDQKNKKLGR